MIALQTPADPIFAAIRDLDRAADAYAVAWSAWADVLSVFDPQGVEDWGEGAAIIRRRFGATAGPALMAYALVKQRMDRAAEADTRAMAEFVSTRPTSEIGVVAYRAAARRYAGRVTGCVVDEEVMLGRLDAMMAVAA